MNRLRDIRVDREKCLILVLFCLSIGFHYFPEEIRIPIYRGVNEVVIYPLQVFFDRVDQYRKAVDRSAELEDENARLFLAPDAIRTIE